MRRMEGYLQKRLDPGLKVMCSDSHVRTKGWAILYENKIAHSSLAFQGQKKSLVQDCDSS